MQNIEIWKTLATIALTGIFALSGALGSQWIAGKNALRAKHLEILFSRKADAYGAFLERACIFVANHTDFGEFLLFQSALQRALIVASPEVAQLLDLDPTRSIHVEAIRLRGVKDERQEMEIKMNGWRKSMGSLISAMRADLEALKSK